MKTIENRQLIIENQELKLKCDELPNKELEIRKLTHQCDEQRATIEKLHHTEK